MKSLWQYKVMFICNGQDFIVNNLMLYYVIISNVSVKKGGNLSVGFILLMMELKIFVLLNVKMDSVLVLIYINDYGVWMLLYFKCIGNNCQVDEEQSCKG